MRVMNLRFVIYEVRFRKLLRVEAGGAPFARPNGHPGGGVGGSLGDLNLRFMI
jgi:hypothetical protein